MPSAPRAGWRFAPSARRDKLKAMDAPVRTRLALLGTLAELHRQPIAYDLARLRRLVADLAPDLLCAEITRSTWETGDLSAAALEVREALAPVVAATDIVLVPVAPTLRRHADFPAPSGLRRHLSLCGHRLLHWGERQAATPQRVNGTWFGAFCHIVCHLNEIAWKGENRAAWVADNATLAENILDVVRRDPGRRVLVAVQCQRLHRLISLLRAHAGALEIVDYREL